MPFKVPLVMRYLLGGIRSSYEVAVYGTHLKPYRHLTVTQRAPQAAAKVGRPHNAHIHIVKSMWLPTKNKNTPACCDKRSSSPTVFELIYMHPHGSSKRFWGALGSFRETPVEVCACMYVRGHPRYDLSLRLAPMQMKSIIPYCISHAMVTPQGAQNILTNSVEKVSTLI